MRDAARPNDAFDGEVTQEVRRRLALDSGIGRENQLAHFALVENAFELANAQLLRPDAIQRRQMPHQYEVPSPETARLLHRHDIGRRLDHTYERCISLRCG